MTEPVKEEIENSIIEVAKGSTFMEVTDKVISKLDSLATEYGAEAFDLVLTLLQIKAGWAILSGLMLITVCILAFKYARKAFKAGKENYWQEFPILLILSSGLTVLTFILSLKSLLSFTTWLMLFSPKMGLIWMAVSKVISF